MPKWTPGPLIVGKTTRGLSEKIAVKKNDAVLAILEPFDYDDPDDVAMAYANAHLFAAAPDLYDAARKALDSMPVGPEKDALVDALLKASEGFPGARRGGK